MHKCVLHGKLDQDDGTDGGDLLVKDSVRQGDKREQLVQELRMREQELEFTLTKQREVNTASIHFTFHCFRNSVSCIKLFCK